MALILFYLLLILCLFEYRHFYTLNILTTISFVMKNVHNYFKYYNFIEIININYIKNDL